MIVQDSGPTGDHLKQQVRNHTATDRAVSTRRNMTESLAEGINPCNTWAVFLFVFFFFSFIKCDITKYPAAGAQVHAEGAQVHVHRCRC